MFFCETDLDCETGKEFHHFSSLHLHSRNQFSVKRKTFARDIPSLDSPVCSERRSLDKLFFPFPFGKQAQSV